MSVVNEMRKSMDLVRRVEVVSGGQGGGDGVVWGFGLGGGWIMGLGIFGLFLKLIGYVNLR